MTSVHPRITVELDKRDGNRAYAACGLRFRMSSGGLGNGMTEKEILEEHPGLEKEDFAAVYAYAADMAANCGTLGSIGSVLY